MFLKMFVMVQSKMQEERGAVAGEYALLLALISAVLVGAIAILTGSFTGAFQAAADRIAN